MAGNAFQVKLGGEWKDYSAEEDKILKRAHLAGFPKAAYKLRNYHYETDFLKMKQWNKDTNKTRQIRPPHKWKAPSAPITKPGPTTCITVPPGSPGTTIQVPNPKDETKTTFIAVNVPATAKVGQAMLVPIPEGPPAELPASEIKGDFTPVVHKDEKEKKKWSTGAKVAAVGGGALVVGGVAVGGALLGEHIAEEGWDATLADIGDVATTAGEGIADGAEAAVEWVGDAAETAGDFIMDLF